MRIECGLSPQEALNALKNGAAPAPCHADALPRLIFKYEKENTFTVGILRPSRFGKRPSMLWQWRGTAKPSAAGSVIQERFTMTRLPRQYLTWVAVVLFVAALGAGLPAGPVLVFWGAVCLSMAHLAGPLVGRDRVVLRFLYTCLTGQSGKAA